MAADGDVQRKGQELAAAVLRSRWAQLFDVWTAVRRAWSGVRVRCPRAALVASRLRAPAGR
ncbi:hypothetical protein ACF07S_32360 [Streptomyces sp. NPDC016640]|uniref:hypothetical protein n=1 Tax=Streptomyces sp. NPDC016640 TaxID=3364969 RepID=UPI0036F8367B